MSENNPSIFNMGSLFTVVSESKNERITFGAYNGALNFIVNRSDGVKFTSKRVSPEYYTCIKDAITEVMKGVPGAAFPIITNKWDNTSRKYVIDCVFTIGKDTNGIFYLEFKEGDFAPVKFPFVGSKVIDFNGVSSDSEKSHRVFRAFNHFVNVIWPTSSFLTRNNLQTFKPGNNQNPKSSKSTNYNNYSNNTTASEDDIY